MIGALVLLAVLAPFALVGVAWLVATVETWWWRRRAAREARRTLRGEP